MKITNARLYIKSSDGKWTEVGGVREIEMTTPPPDEDTMHFILPQSFEFECTFTWARHTPFALSLPPAGCVPMFN